MYVLELGGIFMLISYPHQVLEHKLLNSGMLILSMGVITLLMLIEIGVALAWRVHF